MVKHCNVRRSSIETDKEVSFQKALNFQSFAIDHIDVEAEEDIVRT